MWSFQYLALINVTVIFVACILQKTHINFAECIDADDSSSSSGSSSSSDSTLKNTPRPQYNMGSKVAAHHPLPPKVPPQICRNSEELWESVNNIDKSKPYTIVERNGINYVTYYPDGKYEFYWDPKITDKEPYIRNGTVYYNVEVDGSLVRTDGRIREVEVAQNPPPGFAWVPPISDADYVPPVTYKDEQPFFHFSTEYRRLVSVNDSASSPASTPASTPASSRAPSPTPDSDRGSDSDSDSDIPLLEKYSTAVLFNIYKQAVSNCSGPSDVIRKAMIYMSRDFPQDLLAKTDEELRDPEATIHRFQDKALGDLNLTQKVDELTFLSFRTAIATYNAALILKIEDPAFIERIFILTLDKQIERYNSP